MFAFVLMPFEATFDDVYRIGIKETCEKLDVRAERVDEQIFHQQNILQRIYDQIRLADFIIADMTGRNPNVFYEVGYAHGLGKICLLLTSNADDIPFDLKHHRHIIYGNSIQNLRQSLDRDLNAIKTEIANRKSAVSLTLTASGELDKTDYTATAKVSFSIDLKNNTSSPTPEIEALYLYTGKVWAFTQDGNVCSSTSSDRPDFPLQHFVKSPVRRLSPGSWAQIQLAGTKLVEYSADTEKAPLSDTYRLQGRVLVRLVTDEGQFDFPSELDLEVSYLPF